MGGFTIITGDRKKKIAYVNLPIRNLILKALIDSGADEILEDGIVWSDERPYIMIYEVKKDNLLQAFEKALKYLKKNEGWKAETYPVEWEGGESDRTVAMKVLTYLIQRISEYEGETVIFRDDYMINATEDYPDLYKL